MDEAEEGEDEAVEDEVGTSPDADSDRDAVPDVRVEDGPDGEPGEDEQPDPPECLGALAAAGEQAPGDGERAEDEEGLDAELLHLQISSARMLTAFHSDWPLALE